MNSGAGWQSSGGLILPPASPECSSNSRKDPQETRAFARAETQVTSRKHGMLALPAKCVLSENFFFPFFKLPVCSGSSKQTPREGGL